MLPTTPPPPSQEAGPQDSGVGAAGRAETARRGIPLRIGLAGLVLAAMLPLLAFSAWMVARMAETQRANAENQAYHVAQSLTVAVERELSAMIATLQVLSTAHGFTVNDMADLHRQASDLLRNKEIRREGTNIVLAAAEGQQLWSTRLPYGTPLPDAGGSPMLRRVAETGEPAVSDLFVGTISNSPLVTVGVPVWDGNHIRYILSMSAPAGLWAGVMQRQGVPDGWNATLSDAKGRIIARTPFDPVPVVETTSAFTTAATAGRRSGTFRDDSGPAEVFTAFARSVMAGWMVTVSMPAARIDAPLRYSLTLMAVGGGVVLLLSTGLTLLLGRRIAGPVTRLQTMADALGRGITPAASPMVIREVSAVAEALRAASRRLKDADAQRRLSMEAGRIGVWRFDPVTLHLHGWGRTAELLGIGPAGELDAPLDVWLLHVPLEHIDGLHAALMPGHASVEEFDLEFPVEPPDSPRRWLAMRGSFLAEAVPGTAGLSTRAVGVLEDVTERRRIMEERLIEASERHAADRRLFAAIVERTSDLVAAIDTSHRLILFNTAYQQNVEWAFGHSPRIGSRLEARDDPSLEDLEDPQSLVLISNEVFTHWQRALAGERFTTLRAFASLVTPGAVRHVEVVYDVIPGSDGAPIGAFMVGRDVTERENALAALRAAEETLRQAQKMEAIGHLTGGIAHDFNNLLQAVNSALYLVEIRNPGPDVMTPLLTAQQAVKRGATLTQHLLAFSRRQRLDPRAVDVAALVDGMQGLMERTLGGTIQILRETAPGLWPALVDANQLEMAILNLSINARDAMPAGGTLTIAVGNAPCPAPPAPGVEPGDYVRIAVRDTGTGMSDEVAARAFEPFFTTKGVGHGTGLGLSMVHGLAAQSGGAVLLDSRLGHGTTVTLLLPRAAAAGAVEPDTRPAAPLQTECGPAATVLLVEDEALVRMATAALLSEHGFAVEEAGTGEEALDLAARRRPDAVVTDYAMPGMTGLELTRRLRAAHPGLPVVMVTGYAEIPQPLLDEERLVVLQKPYLTDELLKRLRDGLAGAA